MDGFRDHALKELLRLAEGDGAFVVEFLEQVMPRLPMSEEDLYAECIRAYDAKKGTMTVALGGRLARLTPASG